MECNGRHGRVGCKNSFFKNNIPSPESDKGAKGYGIVAFAVLRLFHVPAGVRTLEEFETIRGYVVAGTVECRNDFQF
ncbi:MAG: hypothetical protein RB294_05810 [Bacteroidales bacterium]|jgi:hypothetical protein|nr:hypothetical protein [Bacteroidales bacterium]HPB01571.1 hypothetical protein [Bacteroidales bacterium]